MADADISSLGMTGDPPFFDEVNLLIYAWSFGIREFSEDVYSRSVYLLRIEIEIEVLE